MKPIELRPGKTYVGRNGKRRCLHELRRANLADGVPLGTIVAVYDVPEGVECLCCSARAFARWAVREATPEEAAP